MREASQSGRSEKIARWVIPEKRSAFFLVMSSEKNSRRDCRRPGRTEGRHGIPQGAAPGSTVGLDFDHGIELSHR